MTRLSFVLIVGIALTGIASANAETETELLERARAIHERVITVDTHVDIPFDFGTEAYDMMRPGRRGQQVHIPTMIEGGLDTIFLITYVGQGPRTTSGHAKALSDAYVKFSAIHKLTAETYPDKVSLALTADDVRRINASGRKAVVIGMENGYPMGRNIELLDVFYDYGARYFGLLHNGHNELGDSAVPAKGEPESEHDGLSDLGKQVVQRLNELGIMVDISHSAEKTALDAMALSKAPVIASHSSVDGVYMHARNASDAVLDGIKRTGGVVQIVAFDTYLTPPPPEKLKATAALREEMGLNEPGAFGRMSDEERGAFLDAMDEIHAKWPKARVSNLVDHIDYAVERIGVDHVGISSDFNGGGGITGWNDASETLGVTVEMVKRGYSEEDIEKIWSGNLMRVMEEVEAYAVRNRSR